MKILVSDPVSDHGVAILKKEHDVDVKLKLSSEELVKIIPGYDALVVRSETKVTKPVIEAAENLKVIGRAGVGVDNIDVDAATKKGIIVLNAPEGNTIAATEHTVAMMLALARNIPQAHSSEKAGEWQRNKFVGVEMRGKTLAVLGLGRIGSGVAKRAIAMEMRVVAYDPFISAEQARALGAASRAAGDADVRGVERAIERVRRADARLGAQRPELVSALLLVLDERLDAARRLRLARDQWAVKAESFDAYRKAVRRPFDDLAKARRALEDVKALAGPDLSRLVRVERTLLDVQARLARVPVPGDLAQAHALATSATQLASNAARLRRNAIETGQMRPAWDASAAAAGALMLIDRAREAVTQALEPPRLR